MSCRENDGVISCNWNRFLFLRTWFCCMRIIGAFICSVAYWIDHRLNFLLLFPFFEFEFHFILLLLLLFHFSTCPPLHPSLRSVVLLVLLCSSLLFLPERSDQQLEEISKRTRRNQNHNDVYNRPMPQPPSHFFCFLFASLYSIVESNLTFG